MKAQTIFRVEKNADNPFVMIDRRVIENPALSWKAKGMLAYLLSRPDNWVIRFADLVKRSPDGGHTVRACLKELRKARHLKIETIREGGRVKEWIYTVFEIPSPDDEFQQVEKQQIENRTFNNKDVNQEESTRYTPDPIFAALESLSGGLNSNTPRFVDTWREKHTDEWILKAVEMSKGKSIKYADSILIGWEANGYPKSREERVKERKAPKQIVPTEAKHVYATPEQIEAARLLFADELAGAK